MRPQTMAIALHHLGGVPVGYEAILCETKGRIAYITLNRPEVLNALNDTMNQELVDALREFDADQQAWVAILSGKGRCFCSGADVRQRQLRPPVELARLGGPVGARPTDGVLGLGRAVNWKPVIAAIHGYAIGAGFSMAMECDLIVAAENTQFQITEVGRGLGAPQHWAKAWFWGAGKFATQIALTGQFFSAEEANRFGMVNRVVPADQHITEAERLAEEIMANPPLSVRCNVRMSRWQVRRMCEDAEMYWHGLKLYLTEDFRESAEAFIEKRKPVFKGK